ncbi:hypothetical protein [Phenylobacterium sp.]|jgi:hypothetical protein|uniref:hypothetical protein n=1 Tax=Phenylobacterium sp. TaxID=1871053 RepID=UPI002F3EE575
MRLTDAQVLLLTEAAVLMARGARVLSDFEVEMVASTGQRWLQLGREAPISAAEWLVVEEAVAAMRAPAGERAPASASRAA